MLRNIILLVGILMVVAGCQSTGKKWAAHDLIIPDSIELTFPQTVTSAQVSSDVSFLIYALENAYGGRNHAPSNTVKNTIANLKNISGEMSTEQLRDLVDRALLEIPDSHLKAKLDSNISQARRDLRRRPNVGKNNISAGRKVWDVRIDKTGRKNILYVSILKFPAYENKVWAGFINAVKKNLKVADAVVLDIRGNTGGDDSIGMELAELLFGHPFEYPVARQYISRTPETFALWINSFKLDAFYMQKDGEEVPPYLEDRLKKFTDDFRLAQQGLIAPLYVRTNKGTGSRHDPVTGFMKPIFILMDAGCGSSCESTIAAFEWHTYVKRVGENTQGCTHFGNVGALVLPNSKIEIQMPTQYSEFFDGRFIENIGISPDIRVAPDGDAYIEVKKILNPG